MVSVPFAAESALDVCTLALKSANVNWLFLQYRTRRGPLLCGESPENADLTGAGRALIMFSLKQKRSEVTKIEE